MYSIGQLRNGHFRAVRSILHTCTFDQRLVSKVGFFILKKLMKKMSKKKFLRKNTTFVHLYAIQCNLTIKTVEKRIKKSQEKSKCTKSKLNFFFFSFLKKD